MQLNVTLYKFIFIIINTFAPRKIGYDFLEDGVSRGM